MALYLAADVMLVTALRDGMNLVAKEYVATRVDEDGVLVLSEFAGASDELRQALLINPHDIEGLKETVLQALAMPRRDRTRRMRALRKKVLTNDVARWSASFLDALPAPRTATTRCRTRRSTGAERIPLPDSTMTPEGRMTDTASHLPPASAVALASALQKLATADRLLLALDFDGTLAPFVDVPRGARALPESKAALDRLEHLPNTWVAYVSGRPLSSLETVTEADRGCAARRLARRRDPVRARRRLARSERRRAADAGAAGGGAAGARRQRPGDEARDQAGRFRRALPRSWATGVRRSSPGRGRRAAAVSDALTSATARTSSSSRCARRTRATASSGCASTRRRPQCSSRATTSPTRTASRCCGPSAATSGSRSAPGETAAQYRVADERAIATLLGLLAQAREAHLKSSTA